MLGEPTNNSKECREKTTEIMFEKFKVPALYMAKNAVLSAFATAKQTALVVDAGHESTTGERAVLKRIQLGIITLQIASNPSSAVGQRHLHLCV